MKCTMYRNEVAAKQDPDSTDGRPSFTEALLRKSCRGKPDQPDHVGALVGINHEFLTAIQHQKTTNSAQNPATVKDLPIFKDVAKENTAIMQCIWKAVTLKKMFLLFGGGTNDFTCPKNSSWEMLIMPQAHNSQIACFVVLFLVGWLGRVTSF